VGDDDGGLEARAGVEEPVAGAEGQEVAHALGKAGANRLSMTNDHIRSPEMAAAL
jgi:hypothetical protein